MCVCVRMCMCACGGMRAYVCVCLCMYACVCVCACANVYVWVWGCACAWGYACVCVRVRGGMRACVCVCVLVLACTSPVLLHNSFTPTRQLRHWLLLSNQERGCHIHTLWFSVLHRKARGPPRQTGSWVEQTKGTDRGRTRPENYKCLLYPSVFNTVKFNLLLLFFFIHVSLTFPTRHVMGT